jgi:hypothetical protein
MDLYAILLRPRECPSCLYGVYASFATSRSKRAIYSAHLCRYHDTARLAAVYLASMWALDGMRPSSASLVGAKRLVAAIYCLEAVLDGGGQYTTMLGHSHIIHLATDGQLIHLRIDYRHEHLCQKGTV